MLYALKDCANLRVDSASDGKTKLFVNYARSTTLSFSSDQVFAYNKNVKAVRFDGNREGTFTTTMEVFPMDIIPLLFGTEFNNETVPWAKREVLKVTSGTATLVGTPKTGSLQVFKIEEDDKLTHIAEQTVGTTTTANKYSISGNTLTFNTTETFAEDGWVACYYFVDTPVKTFTVDNVSSLMVMSFMVIQLLKAQTRLITLYSLNFIMLSLRVQQNLLWILKMYVR